MKTILFLIILQASAFQLYSQKMYEEQFSNCPLKFILEDKELYINYEPNDSIMIVDFLSDLEEKYKKRLQGAVMMQVMIDTGNNVCCVSYTNKTTLSNKRLNVPEILNNMSGWKRNASELPKTNICALISIIFDKKDVTVMRTGYNRNKGRKIVYSTTFRRYAEPKLDTDIKIDSLPKSDTIIHKE